MYDFVPGCGSLRYGIASFGSFSKSPKKYGFGNYSDRTETKSAFRCSQHLRHQVGSSDIVINFDYVLVAAQSQQGVHLVLPVSALLLVDLFEKLDKACTSALSPLH